MRIIILILAFFSAPSLSTAEPKETRILSIAEFKEAAFTSGNHKIYGYAVKHYICPPCPAPAQCKPCMRDNLLLGEKPESLDVYPARGNYLVIFTPNPEQLKPQIKYTLTVKVTPQETSATGYKDLELIGFELSK